MADPKWFKDTFEAAKPAKKKVEKPKAVEAPAAEEESESGLSPAESLQIERDGFDDVLNKTEEKLAGMSEHAKDYKDKDAYEEARASLLGEKRKALTELADIAHAQGDKVSQRKYQESLSEADDALRGIDRRAA